MNAKLYDKLKYCDDVTADSVWAILRYKNIGILRKVMCICKILNLDSATILSSFPTDESGRYLDKPIRKEIHEVLIKRSYELATKSK